MIVRLSIILVLVFISVGCAESSQKNDSTEITTENNGNNEQADTIGSFYHISITHSPYMITGFFNSDAIADTALIIRHPKTGKDALLIRHGGTNETILFKNGKDIGHDFNDFNWVGQFEIINKGTVIWDNVIDGEIVTEDKVPENKKIRLTTDAILLHEEEGGGGGIIYFDGIKYTWVQQD